MKKGFFLLAALAGLFSAGGFRGPGLKTSNKSLKNVNPISGGGAGNTKNMKRIMEKNRRLKKVKKRTAKQSRNINHKKQPEL